MAVTEEEEARLWDRWEKDHCADAANELIKCYMPLVHYHVQRIAMGLPRTVQQDELNSLGLEGLYDALEKYERKRDYKFDTYASFRVRGAIIDGLRKEDWLPRTVREKVKKVESAIGVLQQRCGRTVTSEEVAVELGMTSEEVDHMMSEYFNANFLSIDEKNHETERNETYAAIIEDKDEYTPEKHVHRQAINSELASLIQKLTEQEQLVISLFYYEEMTLTEIGKILNLTTSRISQIHSKSIFRLQQVIKRDKGLLL